MRGPGGDQAGCSGVSRDCNGIGGCSDAACLRTTDSTEGQSCPSKWELYRPCVLGIYCDSARFSAVTLHLLSFPNCLKLPYIFSEIQPATVWIILHLVVVGKG